MGSSEGVIREDEYLDLSVDEDARELNERELLVWGLLECISHDGWSRK